MKKTHLISSLIALSLIFTSCADNQFDYYTGTVESDRYDVSNEIGAKVISLEVDEGDIVNRGDLLAEMDTSDLEIELKRAQAELAALKSSLQKTKSGTRAEEISKAKIQLNQQLQVISGNESSYENSLKNHQRLESLYTSDAASKQVLDEAKTALDLSRSNLESSREHYNYLAKQLELMQNGATREDVQIQQHKYEVSLWNVRSIENKLSKSSIYANSSGIIESINFLEGEFAPIFSKIASINNLSTIWAKIYVEEKNLYKVSMGSKVEVKADFIKEEPLEGIVTYISSEGEFTPKNIESKENKQEIVYEVKVEISDPQSLLKPGTLVDVYIGGAQNGK